MLASVPHFAAVTAVPDAPEAFLNTCTYTNAHTCIRTHTHIHVQSNQPPRLICCRTHCASASTTRAWACTTQTTTVGHRYRPARDTSPPPRGGMSLCMPCRRPSYEFRRLSHPVRPFFRRASVIAQRSLCHPVRPVGPSSNNDAPRTLQLPPSHAHTHVWP
eukprot:GHVU01158237.1.p1 GENE.GHVU01158237.1~~GHVU01158237.1.p1  ORF type:complete len:161 (+),score=2.34 GHVU01158237.1:173-655(+)